MEILNYYNTLHDAASEKDPQATKATLEYQAEKGVCSHYLPESLAELFPEELLAAHKSRHLIPAGLTSASQHHSTGEVSHH